jgi:hypothetical protein
MKTPPDRIMASRPRATARRAGLSGGILLASVLGHLLVLLALLRPSLPEPRLLDDIGAIDLSLVDARGAAPHIAQTGPSSRSDFTDGDPSSPTPSVPDIHSIVTGLVQSVDATSQPQSSSPANEVAMSVANAVSAASGTTCKLGEWLQGALQQDDQVGSALAHIPRPSRSIANALMVWDGSWVNAPSAGPGLSVIRGAIVSGIRSAPQPCRTELMSGPVLLTLNDTSGATLLAIGSGQWRWDDLLRDAGTPAT